VAFAAGLVALGVGAFLWLGDSSGRSDKPSVNIVRCSGPGEAAIWRARSDHLSERDSFAS
jgi:hypothetical protein